MDKEIVYFEERAFSENTRNLLIYLGIGATAGVGCAVVYNQTVYSDVRVDYDTKTATIKDLEQTAEALEISAEHLVSRGLIAEDTSVVMETERTELVAEAHAVRKDTPNILVEQFAWAGFGIIPGLAVAIGAWSTHRKWKRNRQG